MERFGQGCLLVLSSPSYEGALGYEATRDAWRRISGSPRPSRTCYSNVSVLPTHPFIAEVPPYSWHSIQLGPRAFFSTANLYPIGPGLCAYLSSPSHTRALGF